MRKTYREKNVQSYWNSRWTSSEVDSAMKNTQVYPLYYCLDFLKNSNIADTYILEAGCGNGRILRFFYESGYKILGIDFIESAINKINSLKLGLKAEVGDITNLRYKDGIFSHVFAFGLYHNFEENMMNQALTETQRVLKNGGLLCASFRADNIQNYINDKFFYEGLGENRSNYKKVLHNEFHKINLTKKEIITIVENNGFNVYKVSECENMSFLYKIRFFRHKSHKNFDESLARRDGYKLNLLGSILHKFVNFFFKSHFCNLYVIYAKKVKKI